jgi:hypothetical protein
MILVLFALLAPFAVRSSGEGPPRLRLASLTVLSLGPRLAGKPSKGEKWCYGRSRRNGKNWRFFSGAQTAVSRLFRHRARSELSNLPCVASMGSGWLVAPYRAPFFIGAPPASSELQAARSALARGETDISLQWDVRGHVGLQVHNRASHWCTER